LPRKIQVFQETPQPGNAFYLGFSQNIARNILVIGMDCEKLGVGVNPDEAPLAWEYWDQLQTAWLPLEVNSDTTGGLTVPFSEVEVYIPLTAGQREVELVPGSDDTILAWWIRCRYKDLGKNQPGFNNSPVVRRFNAYSIGGTAIASHSQRIHLENLGRSNGEPGQLFKLQNTPILALNPAENETIMIDGLEGQAPELWKQVSDFSGSGPNDKHFVCDYVTGEISFGPALRNPQGIQEQWGAIPPFGSLIIMTAYRTGGSTEGNVGSKTITVLKSSIPYIDTVINYRSATGGTNSESLEHALMRGPRTLRARNRAVTAEDFEVLTREATGGVARVRCLTPGSTDRAGLSNGDWVEPGTVVLTVVPEVEAELRELRPEHLEISAGMRSDIISYLDERRLLTTQLDLTIPKYQWVTIQTRIKTFNSFVNERVKREAERRLYSFIRPVQGGPDPGLRFEVPGEGWPFGRILYISEIYPILQTIEGVEFVEKVELFPVIDLARGQAGASTTTIDPGSRGLLCSYRHQVVLI
jgi:predicted phage baseplate assembly protein